jgi:ketosteroid isomerase-like protein
MSEENVALVRRIYDGWSRGDFSAGADLIAPDFEWQQHAEAVEPGARRGDAVGASLRNIFEIYENFRVEPEEFIDAGQRVVVVARVSATERRTGMPLEGSRWAFIWTVRDGRLVRNQVYADRAQAIEAAGVDE